MWLKIVCGMRELSSVFIDYNLNSVTMFKPLCLKVFSLQYVYQSFAAVSVFDYFPYVT